MQRFQKVLKSSFRLMIQEPRLFAPKLLSMSLSSIWIVLFLSGDLSSIGAVASLPFLGIISMIASLMVASMVKDRGRDELLFSAFKESLKHWKQVIIVSLLVMLTGFVAAAPLAYGLVHYYNTGSVTILVLGAVFMASLILGSGYVSYFLPITILEKNSFIGGLKESTKTSTEHYREVTGLLFVSIALLSLAFVSDRYLEFLGYAGFIVGRIVSTVVNTYLFVVSPTFYMEKEK